MPSASTSSPAQTSSTSAMWAGTPGRSRTSSPPAITSAGLATKATLRRRGYAGVPHVPEPAAVTGDVRHPFVSAPAGRRGRWRRVHRPEQLQLAVPEHVLLRATTRATTSARSRSTVRTTSSRAASTCSPARPTARCRSKIGPEGDVYYLAILTGEVRRIRFVGDNRPPVAMASGNPMAGLAPLNVNFSSAGSNDPDAGQAITYLWNFGDGATSTLANPIAPVHDERQQDGDARQSPTPSSLRSGDAGHPGGQHTAGSDDLLAGERLPLRHRRHDHVQRERHGRAERRTAASEPGLERRADSTASTERTRAATTTRT